MSPQARTRGVEVFAGASDRGATSGFQDSGVTPEQSRTEPRAAKPPIILGKARGAPAAAPTRDPADAVVRPPPESDPQSAAGGPSAPRRPPITLKRKSDVGMAQPAAPREEVVTVRFPTAGKAVAVKSVASTELDANAERPHKQRGIVVEFRRS